MAESKEVSFHVLRSVFIHFATTSLKSVLSKGSWESVISTPPKSTSSSDNLKHHEVNEDESFNDLQEKSEEISLNLMENIRQIETDLVNTHNQMVARVQGLQGIDLITEGNFSVGFRLLEKSAAAGDAESLYNLGVAYDSGWMKPKNLKRAKKYYEQAVARDHAAAMYNLAILLDSKSHPQECEDLMKRAAMLGNSILIEVCFIKVFFIVNVNSKMTLENSILLSLIHAGLPEAKALCEIELNSS